MNSYRSIADAPVLGRTANAIAVTWVNVNPFLSGNIQYELRYLEQLPAPPLPEGQTEDPARPGMVMSTTLFGSNLAMTQEEYNAWADDDEYLYELLAVRLGLTLLP
jgi:hypothetical protein